MAATVRHDIGMREALGLCRSRGSILAAWTVLLLLPACAMRNRTARPEPPALTTPAGVSWKPHAGEVFVFEYPEGWAIQTPAGQDPALHRVRLHSESGFDGQILLMREAPKPGTLPTRILEKMQKDEPTLKAEAFATKLAGIPARGYRFSFDKANIPWTGWVVSCTRDRRELCAMGRWPTSATALRAQWSVIARNLRVKEEGFLSTTVQPKLKAK
jgi:hypothetical protein